MKLSYLYVSVPDVKEALAFYRDELGLDEAWREGDSTVAFQLPNSPLQLMVDVPPDSGENWSTGPFYEVDDLAAFMSEHSGLAWVGEPIEIPGGRTVAFRDPGGNIMHVFDQSAAQ